MLMRIRDLREDHDLKQEDIAKILNVSQVAYSNYELGKRLIPYTALVKLANFYGTSVDYLVGNTNDKRQYKKVIKEEIKEKTVS
ncbi:MAG: helix-turn-helix transcriptional regulator [Firmicutes bacterium]|nr:helix-turn-helix transcriptional regulator [Bacillota bacterium]